MTADEETEVQDKLKDEKLIPRTLHAMIGSDGRTRYCGVWGRPPGAAITGQTHRDQFEGNFEQNQADLSDQLLIDVAVSGAGKPQATRDRAPGCPSRVRRRSSRPSPTTSMPGSLGRWRTSVWERIRRHSTIFSS